MYNPKAKITYLFHSGYAVETARHLFIFDYYQPGKRTFQDPAQGIIGAAHLENKTGVYVFVSHSHRDHFDPVIFEWAATNPGITYILSSDIPVDDQTPRHIMLSPYEEWKQENLLVKTFGSTDEGLSFLVRADGLAIFHAGDLNWWRWKEESEAEQAYAETIFKAEIAKIMPESIDIAFFPVDPRLEEFYGLGAEYFADKVQPKLLVPMHFGNDFDVTRTFAAKLQTTSTATVELSRKGQELFF